MSTAALDDVTANIDALLAAAPTRAAPRRGRPGGRRLKLEPHHSSDAFLKTPPQWGVSLNVIDELKWRLNDVDDDTFAQHQRCFVDASHDAMAARPDVVPDVVVTTLSLFPEATDLYEAAITRLGTCSPQARAKASGLVRTAPTLARCLEVVNLFEPIDALNGCDPWSMLDRFGPDVVPLLERLCRESAFSPLSPPAAYTDHALSTIWMACADIFTFTASPPTLKLMLQAANLKDVIVAVAAAAERQPRAMLLACLAAGVAKDSVAVDVAGMILRLTPDAIDVASTELQRAQLAAVADENAAVAAPDALPSTLRAPPWKTARPTPSPSPTTYTLASPSPRGAFEERVEWAPGQQAAWLSAKGWSTPSEHMAARMFARKARGGDRDDVILAHADEQLGPGSDDTRYVALLPDALLRVIWPAYDATAFALDSVNARKLVARLGTGAVSGLLLRAGVVDERHQTRSHDGLMPPRPMKLLAQSLDALGPVRSLRVAPVAAQGLAHKDARKAAVAWLLRFADVAAAALVPRALAAGDDRDDATAALRVIAAGGHRDVVISAAIAAAADRNDRDDVVNAVAAIVDVDPLFLKKAPKLPRWLKAETLAPLMLAGSTPQRLSGAARDIVVGALMASSIDSAYPVVEEVKALLAPQAWSRFGWSLHMAWLMAGAPSVDSWAMTQLAHSGDAGVARRLADQMTVWVTDGLAARAKRGVDVLGAIGVDHDAALMALFQFSEKAKSKSLRASAADMIRSIAEAKGLSVDELADRLVPDLDLDDDGTTSVDLGDRVVRITFNERLEPSFKEPDGSLTATLKRPGAATDKAAHKRAQATQKALAKAAKAIATHALRRLEGAMANERSFDVDTADACFFRHPLMRHVARRLVWVDVDDEGVAFGAFRVDESGAAADHHDDVYVRRGTRVRLLHPASAPANVVAAFSAIFADYELMQPFAQLARPLFRLDNAGAGASTLNVVDGKRCETPRIFTLDARGWTRPEAGVAVKDIGGASVALTFSPGVSGGPDAHRGHQTLGPLHLSGASHFGALSEVLISELLYDLDRLHPA